MARGALLWSAFFYAWRCFPIKPNEKGHMINENIDFPATKQVRVISASGDPVGILTYEDALNSAYESDMDLVLIAPNSEPPVCRIMDYGKFRFEREKKDKEAKKKQQTFEPKEIQLSCRIDTNDFNTKLNHAIKFLNSGHKVRVCVRFKGRQVTHAEIGREILDRFCESCREAGTVDKAPKMEGRILSAMIAPIKK